MPQFLLIAVGGSNGTRSLSVSKTLSALGLNLTFTTGKSRFGRGRGWTGRGLEGEENVVVVSLFVGLSGGFVATFLEGRADGSRSGRRGMPSRLPCRLARHDIEMRISVSRPLARRMVDPNFVWESWVRERRRLATRSAAGDPCRRVN